MLLKWLVLGGVVYLLYRYSGVFTALSGGKAPEPKVEEPQEPATDEEYIEYEELD